MIFAVSSKLQKRPSPPATWTATLSTASTMSTSTVLDLEDAISGLPPSPSKYSHKSTQAFLEQSRNRVPILVALDEDPTGTQTCHDINFLTVWDTTTLVEEFRQTAYGSGFFISTNSRALHPPQAKDLMHEICSNLKSAAGDAGVEFEIVLRGDSTLRGHFPLEPEAAEDILGKADAWILCPFFCREAGTP